MRILLVTGFYPGERMGGAEYQTMLLGQGLSKRGHEVVYLATDDGKNGVSKADGLTLWEVPGWQKVGWAEHRRQLADVIEEAKPDVCYVRLLTELASASALCQEAGVPVVSTSCSLKETTPFLTGYHPRETIGYLRSRQTLPHFRSFLAIGSSAAHVCNTFDLQRGVRRWYPRMAIHTIYNGSPLPPPEEIHAKASGQIIWINNLKRGKRPQLFVRLARRLPEYQFAMIGAISKGRYGRSLKSMIGSGPSNLRYLGRVPVDAVNRHIGRSDLLVYTSKARVEGFGNSFLQAWFRQVPTASLSFDLDGILERERVGRFSQSFEQFVADVDSLMEDETERQEMGERARAYALKNHRVETMVNRYEELFQKIAAGH